MLGLDDIDHQMTTNCQSCRLIRQCYRPLKYLVVRAGTNVMQFYDTRCYFNVLSKADMSQLNLPHGTIN